MILEIQNELTAIFSDREIGLILNILKQFQDRKPFSYQTLIAYLVNAGFTDNATEVIDELFYYSLIGNININNEVKFKFREREGEICKIDTNEKIILHYILKVFFRNN